MCHGDAHLGNVVAQGDRLVWVDFEYSMPAAAVTDLVVVKDLRPEDRIQMLTRYLELTHQPVQDVDLLLEDCLRQARYMWGEQDVARRYVRDAGRSKNPWLCWNSRQPGTIFCPRCE